MNIYLVGGAVRDELMGIQSNDYDYVVVGATEQDMLDRGYKKVGADFPVFMDDVGSQFALARKERKTGRGYLGFDVSFDPTVTLEDDLIRRDLTINSIAKNIETNEIIDPYGGVNDINSKVLRATSDAFKEDPLRVVRLARFYSRWTDFDIAWATIAMSQDIVASGEMDYLADERFYTEMEKMFKQTSKPLRFFNALFTFNALHTVKFFKDLFGEIDKSEVEMATDAVMRLSDDADDKLASLIALVEFMAPQTSSSIPFRTKRLTNAMRRVFAMQPTAKGALDLFISIRGFDETSNLANDLLRTMSSAEGSGFQFPIEAQVLGTAMLAARKVSADKYMHLKGADIGRAMNEKRLSELKFIIGA